MLVRLSRALLVAVTLGASAGAVAEPTPEGAAPPPQVLLIERRAGEARARILFLPDDADAVRRVADPGATRLTVTGAYSSGDRFGPEGFVMRRGQALNPAPQGWDGLLLVDASGRASLHDVSRVRLGERRFNLRDRTDRRAFLSAAGRAKLSAIQSHLLINEGALDLRPIADAPRFRRRLLFETQDGRIGVFDTSPRIATLYEAAAALLAALPQARMALNLDMGAYDFCERRIGPERRSCGLVAKIEHQKLTNLIELRVPADAARGGVTRP